MSDDTTDEIPQFDPEQPHPADVIQALNAENMDLKDRLLRAMAETDNVRKRAEREKQDASAYAVTRFARDMLDIADNFARALAAAPVEKLDAVDPQIKAVLEGVAVTERQLLAALERHGVKPIETEGARFDPNLHQAIAQVPGNGKPAGAIVNVIQGGYTIGERLLRPAMVTVSSKESGNGAGPVDETA
jgi:molecular chaperone GrpE